MSKYPEAAAISKLVDASKTILVVQADNPDGDSLASSLALEQILEDAGKKVVLFCAIEMPTYLHYLPGWDRVQHELPNQFDLTILVDCSSLTLLEVVAKSGQLANLSRKPLIILDHHNTKTDIEFASIVCNQPVAATGELIYELASQLNWPINLSAKRMMATSILSDSLGLMANSTTARTIHIIGELVEGGVKLTELDDARRTLMRKSPELISYKGELLQRIEYFDDNQIAVITIPWSEIERYSHAYNPSMLVIDDMRLVENGKIAIAFKTYLGGRVTAKIRANSGYPIAAKLAQHFGGNGLDYASGFKVMASNTRNFDDIKKECVDQASELISKQTSK